MSLVAMQMQRRQHGYLQHSLALHFFFNSPAAQFVAQQLT